MAFAPGNNQGLAIADLQRKFVDLPKHFDKFIEYRDRKHPNVLVDRFARGQFPYFSGLEQHIQIFHGTVGEQAGLSNFRRVQLSRVPSGDDPGNDACGPFTSKTFDHAIEARTFTLEEGYWESMPICLNDLIHIHEGRAQAAMIARQLPVVVMSVWETWTREQVLIHAQNANQAFILTSTGADVSSTGPQFSYNPYVEKDYGGTVGQVPYLTFPDSVEVGSLDMSFFDWWSDYLSDECPEAALSNMGGMPQFGLVLNSRDIDDMIAANDKLREDWRYQDPKQLIEGYPLTFKSLRNWVIIHDSRQPRFKVVRRADNVIEARRVLPKRYVSTTLGQRPEANPDYISAELAVGFVMMNDVFSTLVPGNIPNLGNKMVFGPHPGLNGQFDWVNEYHKELNPNREKGNYRARFRMGARPGMFARNIMAFLYTRTPHILAGVAQRVGDGETAKTSTTIAVAAVSGDFDTTNYTLEVKLADKLDVKGLNDEVTMTPTSGSAYTGYISETVNAPTYVVTFAADHSADVAKFDTNMTVALA